MGSADLDVIRACLRASVEGPFFPEWEFQTLFGLSRAEVAAVLGVWPIAIPNTAVAVSSALTNLVGYPHGRSDAWPTYIEVDEREVERLLARWREENSVR